MEIHTLSDGHRIGSVNVVLSGDALASLEHAAEALGRTAEDLATAAVEEAVHAYGLGRRIMNEKENKENG